MNSVSEFVEIFVTLLPSDAGGRTSAIAPRNGTYMAAVRSAQGERARVRFLEGPPQIAPGDGALVVAELDGHGKPSAGDELDLIEPGERHVGIVTLLRVLRRAVAL